MLFRSVFVILAVLTYTETAKILGIFTMSGISHYIVSSKLMIGLAEAGHDVTLVSPFPLKNPPKNGTFTDVVLDGFAEAFQNKIANFDMFKSEEGGTLKKFTIMTDKFLPSANQTLHHPKMKQIVESGQKYDAVIMEQFANDAHKVYAHIFGCPLILLSSVGPHSGINPTVGNPSPVSYAPHLRLNDFSKDLSFINRARNLMYNVADYLFKNFYDLPKQEEIMHAMYPDAPSLYDLYTNVSLVLLNSHTSIYPALPLVPNMVEIGGYFIDPPKKLPKDLQDYMDSAKDGVVYFSMGSNLKSKDMSEERKQIILNVLAKMRQKVIWKFEQDLPGKPSNVMIRKWYPQQDILAHPNVRLFITHGGLLSTTETIYHGVPILAIPVFGDQHQNAARAEADGYGLTVGYNDPGFSEGKLDHLVNELLNNPKYKRTAQEKSKIYHDRPMQPMDTAVYWVEYVIRHKGAPHLRVAGVRLPWYKYFMLDVIGSIVTAFVLVIYILKLAIRKLIYTSGSTISKKQKIL